ncbi:M42 family metallopeptidase [Halovivax cerinus]|uniref:M42 family metallopeptidase n=1 Tax=Halovivax cerinus TaxID=1487865 RepID=A0ABD5NS97_9EURY|nr:M20/M25/M40 family metallo-hydrolase [Halovivax cerinus]
MSEAFDWELLRELTEATGISGFEGDVREIVRRELEESTDSVSADALGNVVGTVDGTSAYSVVVAAHIDEWGWMVERVTEDGFLELETIGGTNPATPVSQRVTVRTADGSIPGIIGAVPPHMLTEDVLDLRPTEGEHPALSDDVYVELGLPADEVRERVTPGDQVTLRRTTERLGECVTGKAFDNRALVHILLEAARRIEDPDVTIHFAGTSQEEIGLRGATGLATDLDPDLAIALDISVANDQPYFDEDDRISSLGEGTAIKVKDRDSITNPLVTRRLRDLAEQRGIPHQLEITNQGGTDTAAFQRAHGSKPTGALLLPTRNIHSNTACASVGDIEATIDLLTAFLETEAGDEYIA